MVVSGYTEDSIKVWWLVVTQKIAIKVWWLVVTQKIYCYFYFIYLLLLFQSVTDAWLKFIEVRENDFLQKCVCFCTIYLNW